ncbi:protease modulator HflC [Candidatus Bipolaricaulota bacterium]|nr:protease modulator HflC [Candidatus Bipolaricaulota bacterium]MBS3814173.1 protease modulator HflC [Candidatus Bipolaricaulota bacterium]MBS3825872.1 protease modulator HflC [Candidatus Bipolaricaulota bacterium]
MRKLAWFVGIVVALIIIFNLLTFTVDETKQAIVVQYGDIKNVATEPGLYFKIPFIQSVQHMEGRLLSYDIEPRKLITSDQRRLRVNNYAVWRIEEPGQFRESLNARLSTAQTRIDDIVYSDLRNVLASYEFSQIASSERENMLAQITEDSAGKLTEYGINLIDVKIKRADLPEANEQAVFDRMISERERRAAQLRAEGDERSKEIESEADRKSSVIIAEARREAETIRGEGEATALDIYSKAYSQDVEFYEFWRKLSSYRKSFPGGKSTILITPDSQYLNLLSEGVTEQLKLKEQTESQSKE